MIIGAAKEVNRSMYGLSGSGVNLGNLAIRMGFDLDFTHQ